MELQHSLRRAAGRQSDAVAAGGGALRHAGFFGVTQQRLISGRLLQQSDDERPESPLVVVVNQALVARDFKGQDPIGKRFYSGDNSFGTIVGVVSNIRNMGRLLHRVPRCTTPNGRTAAASRRFR